MCFGIVEMKDRVENKWEGKKENKINEMHVKFSSLKYTLFSVWASIYTWDRSLMTFVKMLDFSGQLLYHCSAYKLMEASKWSKTWS